MSKAKPLEELYAIYRNIYLPHERSTYPKLDEQRKAIMSRYTEDPRSPKKNTGREHYRIQKKEECNVRLTNRVLVDVKYTTNHQDANAVISRLPPVSYLYPLGELSPYFVQQLPLVDMVRDVRSNKLSQVNISSFRRAIAVELEITSESKYRPPAGQIEDVKNNKIIGTYTPRITWEFDSTESSLAEYMNPATTMATGDISREPMYLSLFGGETAPSRVNLENTLAKNPANFVLYRPVAFLYQDDLFYANGDYYSGQDLNLDVDISLHTHQSVVLFTAIKKLSRCFINIDCRSNNVKIDANGNCVIFLEIIPIGNATWGSADGIPYGAATNQSTYFIDISDRLYQLLSVMKIKKKYLVYHTRKTENGHPRLSFSERINNTFELIRFT